MTGRMWRQDTCAYNCWQREGDGLIRVMSSASCQRVRIERGSITRYRLGWVVYRFKVSSLRMIYLVTCASFNANVPCFNVSASMLDS